MNRVLLVEEGWHATMYLATALEHAGFAVTVLSANGTSASCRRRTVRWTSGPPIASERFVPHVDRLMAAFDHVVPLTEPAMDRLWDAQRSWSDRIFPSTEAWQRRLLRNKHALVEHMAAHGIAVPQQQRIVDRARLELPLVIKGATGSGGKMVRIVETRSALEHAVTRARAIGGDWVVQELVAGPTFLFGGVFHEGRPLRIYAGEKLEQYPARTGGAIRIRSVDDAALVELGLRTMRELRWTGFASADFVRRDGRYLLLEVNPRLWGSLAGAEAAGVDLFTPFAQLLAGDTPTAELGFTANHECLIFPRYLSSAAHRNLRGARQALRDLRGAQGRDWRDPVFVVHILRRLFWMRRQSPRF